MAKNKIIVEDAKGNKRVVQPSMVPQGFMYVDDYKEPKKTQTKPKTEEK